MIQFTVPGQPVAKGRARAFIRNGKIGQYTPDKTARYENLVKLAARVAMDGNEPMECAVSLKVDAFFQIPASWSKKKQADARSRIVRPTGRPDADNVLKAVCDGLNGVVFRDDAQVVHLAVQKSYSNMPRVEVYVWAMA